MKTLLLAVVCLISCRDKPEVFLDPLPEIRSDSTDPRSWTYFLQHLPESRGDVLDYHGQPVVHQEKHFCLINYDVGKKDLQQCADALIRIRTEYLFSQKWFNEMAFHFTNGVSYDWASYCRGIRPVIQNRSGLQTFLVVIHV